MKDLIKRADAIKWFEPYADRGLKIPVETVIQNLKDIPSAEKQGEWIPCSERLPEEHEWIGTKKFDTTISDKVVVTFDVNGERFVKVLSLQNGQLSISDKHCMDAFHKGWKMLAWMPLPPVYEGADDA